MKIEFFNLRAHDREQIEFDIRTTIIDLEINYHYSSGRLGVVSVDLRGESMSASEEPYKSILHNIYPRIFASATRHHALRLSAMSSNWGLR